jgi:hypothetical protein
MAEWLVRLLVGLTVAIMVAVVQLLVGMVRLGLRLLGAVGFRGARLVALAATVLAVGWAAPIVGGGPVVRLAVIGWAAWATRHHRAAIRQHAAVRRLAAAQQAAVRRLTAALQQHADALAAAKSQPPSSSTTPATAAGRDVPAVPAWHRADQPADRAVVALGRYAATWARRHAAPASEEPR